MLLVLGAGSWLILVGLTFARPFVSPIPVALYPALAIWLAAPSLTGNSYIEISGSFDFLAWVLVAVTVAMGAVQLGLLPSFLRTTFGPGTWGFSFVYSTVAILALHTINHVRPGGAQTLRWVAIAARSVIPATLSVLTVRAIARGGFLPRAGD